MVLTIIVVLLTVFSLFYYILGVVFQNNNKVKINGTWAIVSGCTNGIGRCFAELLASKGYNIVCISRSEEKTKYISKLLESDFNIKTISIHYDFSECRDYDENKIINKLEDIKNEICILINCIGLSYKHPEKLHNLNTSTISKIINTNIYSCTFISKLFLKIVKDRNCILVNVSSMLANVPSPLLSVYSSTKSFVTKFTSDIGIEYKNVRCISLSPYFVATDTTKLKPNTFIPKPEEYVYHAFKDIQIGDSRDCTGYFYHTLIFNILKCFPKSILGDVIFSKLNSFKEIYKLKYK